MPQTINTNIASLNAQRNLNTSQSVAGDLDAAPVVGPARQHVEGRRRRPGDRRPHERADPRHQRRDPQRQRRHLAGADRRRRAGHGDRRAAAHARAGGAGAERLATAPATAPTSTPSTSSCRREITRIATQTKFNGTAIVGAGAGAQTFQIGANNGDTLTITTVGGRPRSPATSRPRRNASTALAAIDATLDVDHDQPRHLRRGAEPLRLRDLQPADHRREPVAPRAAGSWTPTSPPRPPTCRARRSCSRPARRWWRRPTSCRRRCWRCCAADPRERPRRPARAPLKFGRRRPRLTHRPTGSVV